MGRIYPVKALDRLIEAFAKCGDAAKGWRLRLVGPDQAGHMAELMSLCDRLGLPYTRPEENGDGVETLGRTVGAGPTVPLASTNPESNNQTIKQLNNLSPRVDFVGPRFDESLSREYAACDCLALVSHTENFGATVVDALAHGKPVITSTKTPWKVVQEKGCGWWTENDVERLARTLGEMMALTVEDRRTKGTAGRRLAEVGYSWTAIAGKFVDAYQAFLLATSVCR